ncbi:MAG: PD-(D/E)XK nuclease family protein [Dehalococcoidia bacterium]|nr:PD-(D/E)XK nuclease family protein [Dehalococcoidia bacterium]
MVEAYGPRDIALGVPDAAVAPYLESALDEYGIPSYDPRGAQLSHHPVFRLLRSWQHLRAQGSYAALSDLLRNVDVLDHLRQSHGIPARALLTELDEFQNTHLPDTMQQVADGLRATRGTDLSGGFHTLSDALQALQPLIASPANGEAEASLRALLQTVYSTRELRPGSRDDQEFRTAAARVDESLRLLSEGCVNSLPLTTDEKTEALLEQLGGGRYTLERQPDSVDLEGWLELAWNDAPLLIVTGMNENSVPQRSGNEAFLPDSLRRLLGLRCEDDRLSRDVYLARTLVESRRSSGRVCFIAGKTGADGEPLRPSRILLRCGDAELPGRARRLFGMPDDVRPSVPSSISFQLLPSRPLQLDPNLRLPSRLAVTSFRDYLECPFRFYLKHVLRMEELADTKREMDALDFGTLVHEVLARMAADAELRSCQSAATLRAFLHRQVEDWACERFGPHPALRLAMQLDVATERLSAAAEAQAEEAAQGWEIVLCERDIELSLGGMQVRGRIDRVDRHRESGVIRILDYKTSDTPRPPGDLHLAAAKDDTPLHVRVQVGEKAKRWTDLQLPLYVQMLAPQFDEGARITSGYFNLPRQTDGTGVQVWDELTDGMLESAAACAQGVVADIQRRRFWPPAAKPQHDDFEGLFSAGIDKCVDGDSFARFMEGIEPR